VLDQARQHSTLDIKTLLNEFSNISNICLNNARNLFSFISIEYPDKSDVKKNLIRVDKMVAYLKRQYEGKYVNRMNRFIAAKRRVDTTKKYHWKNELRNEVFRVFREEIERESIQICAFMAKEPNGNSCDKQILAEAITMKESFNENGSFYIASGDMRFFSPLMLKGGAKSDLVTSAIYNEFGIICNIPQKIRGLL